MGNKHQATTDLLGRSIAPNYPIPSIASVIDSMFLVAMYKAGVPIESARRVFEELAGALKPDMPALPEPWYSFFLE